MAGVEFQELPDRPEVVAARRAAAAADAVTEQLLALAEKTRRVSSLLAAYQRSSVPERLLVKAKEQRQLAQRALDDKRTELGAILSEVIQRKNNAVAAMTSVSPPPALVRFPDIVPAAALAVVPPPAPGLAVTPSDNWLPWDQRRHITTVLLVPGSTPPAPPPIPVSVVVHSQ